MILTSPIGERIDSAMVDRMLAELHRGTPPQRERTIRRELTSIGCKLDVIRRGFVGPDGLSGTLGTGMDYLKQQDDDNRFAIWTGWLETYTACCDLQDRIRDGVLLEAA